MTNKTVQRGLQPLRIIRAISEEDDSFIPFLRWLKKDLEDGQSDIAELIINIVEKPYNFQLSWEKYHETE